MKLKLTKKHNDIDAGLVIDCDEVTAKELLDGQVAIEYTDDVIKSEKDTIKVMVQDAVKKEIENMEKQESTVEVVKDAPIFRSGADFLTSVKAVGCGFGDTKATQWLAQQKAATGIGEGSASIGGALITPSFISDVIFKQMMEESVIMPKCFEHKLAETAGPTALIKQVNETVRNTTSLFGGLEVFKVSEGSNITASLPSFTQKSVTLAKAAVLTYISDEAVRDIVNIVDQTAGMVAQSFAWQIDNDIVNGGLGIASPIVGDAATVQYTVAGAYPTAAEWFGIYNSMHPAYRDGAEWFFGTDTYASLMGSL